MATMLEVLTAAYPEQIERIKECAAAYGTELGASWVGSAENALSCAFLWHETTEGAKYWNAVAYTLPIEPPSPRSEDQPHVVYSQTHPVDFARVLPNYAEAFAAWKELHEFDNPYCIATLGRHCTPAAEIVDVSE